MKAKTKTVNLGKKGSFTSHPGRLHREMGIPAGQKIGVTRERKALKSKNPQERRDARSALGYAAMDHSKPDKHDAAKHVGHDCIGCH